MNGLDGSVIFGEKKFFPLLHILKKYYTFTGVFIGYGLKANRGFHPGYFFIIVGGFLSDPSTILFLPGIARLPFNSIDYHHGNVKLC